MARPANMCSVKHDVLFAPRTRRARCIWAKDLRLTSKPAKSSNSPFNLLFSVIFSFLAEREQIIHKAHSDIIGIRSLVSQKRCEQEATEFFAAGVQVPGPTCLIAIIRYR